MGTLFLFVSKDMKNKKYTLSILPTQESLIPNHVLTWINAIPDEHVAHLKQGYYIKIIRYPIIIQRSAFIDFCETYSH